LENKKYICFAVITAFIFFLSACSGSEAGKKISFKDDGTDMGGLPWVADIEELTLKNENYRVSRWTGKYLQMTLMSLKKGEIIDLEMHSENDQFIRVEKGSGRIFMGKSRENLDYVQEVQDDWVVFIPAGYWHTLKNTGQGELKVYSLYGPAEHPKDTVHKTYKEAAEEHHDH